jgi:hypothetical protein
MFRDPCPTPEQPSQLYNTNWRAPEANKRDTGGTNAGVLRRGVQYLLQASALDGELRYLAYKRAGNIGTALS